MDRLRQFAEVMVVEERFVRDGAVWTAAGVSAGIDMALALIADQGGRRRPAWSNCMRNIIRVDKDTARPISNLDCRAT